MPKACDACHASSAQVYCRADEAYLCVSCDGQVHNANKLASRHERVWMCEVCEVAPAVVTCKADAASLCVPCDTDIHSANSLAQRHERVPISPLLSFDSSTSAGSPGIRDTVFVETPPSHPLKVEDVDAEAVSWLLSHPKIPPNAIIRGSAAVAEAPPSSLLPAFSPLTKPQKSMPKLETLADSFSDVDPFLDLDGDAALTGIRPDSLVPVHIPEGSEDTASLAQSAEPSFPDDAAFPLKGSHNYSCGTSSLTHSMSCSSLDAAVVPDSSLSDISTPCTDSADCGARTGPQQAIDVVDREARVMRYKEKRQKRKFDKTIRYASRKAYAESRPRIKGRFAKRTESDAEHMFGSADSGFGVVPTF